MVTFTQQQFERLPKWAQNHILTQEMQLRDLRSHVEELSEGPADSDTFVEHYTVHPERPLGVSPTIKFKLGEDHWDCVNIATREERRGGRKFLSVMVTGRMAYIMPQASNAFNVYLEDR